MTPFVVRGRGAAENPAHRFERTHVDLDEAERAALRPQTVVLRDRTRSILTTNDSPDVGFRVGLNPYRGCEHGCAYCYARPYHEYLGFSSGLDFETKILVKEDAPALLDAAFRRPSWKPEPVVMAGATDVYQPVEKKFEITRRLLEVFLRYRNPVGIITKNRLIARDVDLLGALAAFGGASVALSVTTLDAELSAVLEPRASRPKGRLEAMRLLVAGGVPVTVMVAPVIPGLTDHEMPPILKAAKDAGARAAVMSVLRLPRGVEEIFLAWLDRHRPESKAKVLTRLRSLRGGRLDDSRFGTRVQGEGPWAGQLRALFETCRRRLGLEAEFPPLSTSAFRVPGAQLRLFD